MAVRKVGSSRIIREIGRGGMAVVYEAYQEGLDRRVAVKALDAGQTRSKEFVERFRREGRAYAQISHAAIVAVHDLVEKDDNLYLVTEFVDGSDLQRVVGSGGGLPPDCVAAVGARLADALDCVHLHAMLHRDVKPANIMISREGAVKLMDFGIAKDPMATGLTKTGTVMGTPAYVAPEVLEGGQANEASDLWSLGVTLYEIATGGKPFSGTDFHELFTSVRRGRARPIRDVSPGFPRRLARAIERCLERRPSRRWETAGALARELEACAAELLGENRPQERLAALLSERGLSTEITPLEEIAARTVEVSAPTPSMAAAEAAPPARAAAPHPTIRSSRRVGWALAVLLAVAAGVWGWLAMAR